MATITNGESQVFDGVKYTAIDGDAELKVENDVVTGITSGKVTAEINGAETTPVITVDGTTAFDFTAKAEDGVLAFTRNKNALRYASGNVTYTANGVSFPAGEVSIKASNAFIFLDTVTFTIPASGFSMDFSSSPIKVSVPEELITTLSGGTASGSFAWQGNFEYDAENKQFKFAQGASITTTDLKLTEDAHALDISITAIEDSTFAIDTSNVLPLLVMKDGASFSLSGEALGMELEENITITGGDISVNLFSLILGNETDLSLKAGATLTIDIENMDPIRITAPNDASVSLSMENHVLTVNAADDNEINIKIGDLDEFSLNVKGTLKLDHENRTITLVKDTVVEFPLQNGSKINITANDDATFVVGTNDSGDITYTPNTNNGTLQLTVTNSDGEEVFDAEIEITKGSFTVNNKTGHISLADGTESKITVGEYTFTTTAKGDAGVTISTNDSGEFTFTPDTNDGTLILNVEGTGETALENVEIEVVSGSFTLDKTNNLSIAKDTELKLSFGDEYSIAFKVTDEAGGKLSFADGGIAYTPNADEGKLEITVTDGENTRTTSLEVTGPINYTLGGIIQLSEGTVLKNEFEDGEVLTISANKDVSGIMYFTSDNGLVIVSDDEDLTLGINFPNNTVANFDSIKGAIVYKGGVVTLTDGTEMKEILSAPPAGDDSEDTPPESEMVSIVKSEGGSSTIDFSVSGKIIFTPGEGATLYTPHDFVISKGSFTLSHEEDLEGANGVLSVGTVATKNSPAADPFTLEKAGTYTLNGNTITTTEDGVEVKLADGNAVVFDVDAAVEVTGHEITGVEGTQVKISNGNKDISVLMSKAGTSEFDGKTFELTEDIDNASEITLTEDGFTVKSAVNEENIDAVKLVENVKISGTEDYTVKIGANGTKEIGNVASGSNIQADLTLYDADDKEWVNEDDKFEIVSQITIVPAEEGTFNFGTNTCKVTTDDSVNLKVEFDDDLNGVVMAVSNLNNGVFEGKIDNELTVNGDEITFSGVTDEFGFIVLEGHIYVGGIEDGGKVEFDSEKVAVEFEGSEVTVNDVTYSIEGDSNGVTIEGNEISLLDKDARITVSKAGTYVVNGTPLDVKTNDVILGVSETEARIYTPIGTNATTENILDDLEVSTDNVEYVTEDSDEETSLSKAEEKAVVVEKDVESDKKVTLGDKGGARVCRVPEAEHL